MPDVVVIDIALPYRHPSLSAGRYYGIMVETEVELGELEEFLDADRPAPVPPALLDHRRSAIASGRITIAIYTPPEPGWPWVMLCHWPAAYAAAAALDSDLFARGAYTIEMFEDEEASVRGARALLGSLARSGAVALTMLPRDVVGGRA